MITDFQSIVDEWSYRVGIIDSKNYKHLYHLNQILYEHGWTQDVIEELSKKLTEDDIVKNKKSGNTYVVKTHNQDTQDLVKKDASPEDVKKVDKGEKDREEPKKKKTGIIAGDASEGDNQVKNDMFKYGYKKFEKATGTKPAPGGAGSAFN